MCCVDAGTVGVAAGSYEVRSLEGEAFVGQSEVSKASAV